MTVRGWCPTLFEPMEAGDGWLLRIKPRRARLSAADLRVIAEVAHRHGNGTIGLTNRANLQLRGFSAASIPPATEALHGAGLADGDPGVERRRNLIVPPLLGLDPALSPDLPGVIAALEALLADPALDGLPGKFGVVVEGGGALPLAVARGDIRVVLDGAVAAVNGVACGIKDVAGVVSGMLRLVARSGEAGPPPSPPAAREGGKGALPSRFLAPSRSAGGAGGGPLRHTIVRFPYGRTTGAALAALAALAGELRVTPWRAIILPGAIDPRQIAAQGGVTDPDDPRLRIVTCPGAPACASAHAETERDAAALLAAWTPDRTVHLSGCAKGCAHPRPAPATLVAQPGGRYALIRDGRAGDAPGKTGFTIQDAARLLRQDAA